MSSGDRDGVGSTQEDTGNVELREIVSFDDERREENKTGNSRSNNEEDGPPAHSTVEEVMEEKELTPTTVRYRYPLFIRDISRSIPEPIKSSLKPPRTRGECLEFLLVKIPILKWVWGYKFNYIIGDIIAGITVAIMHIPQGLAYALLADVDPIYGLYTSFVPVIIYSIFGTSRHISVGTFAVVELMIGNALNNVLSGDADLSENCLNITNSSEHFFFGGDFTTCNQVKVDVVVTLAFLCGLIMFVMGVLQLGFITTFLSEPLISGYTTGAAMHVFTSQLKHIVGVDLKVARGLLSVPKTWIKMFQSIPHFNPATIIISVVAIFFLVIFKILNKLLKSPKVKVPIKVYRSSEKQWVKKRVPWPIPIPSQLIVVIVATIISYFAMLNVKFHVPIVKFIPNGAPAVTVPKPTFMVSLLKDAFVISIVTYAVSVSLAKVFAREFGYSINNNQEFLAYGLMNIVGCFFSSFTAAGSLSRSSIQGSAGGKTQLVGFISSLLILIVLLKLGSLFEPLPLAILASIIWVALYGMFKQFKHVYDYWKLSWWDGVTWVVVFLATTLLGVDLGLGVGIGFSLLVIVLRIILPTSTVHGRAHETEVFRNMDNFEKVEKIPGILIFRFQAPICFVNCRVFRLRLEIACNLLNKTALKQNRNTEGCLQKLCYKTGITHKGSYSVTSQDDLGTAAFNATTNTVHLQDNGGPGETEFNHTPSIEPIHTVIIDCSPIGFMDAVGVKTLQQIVVDFDQLGIQVLFVCMTRENREMMGRSGFFRKCSKKWLFPSMRDAMKHAQYEPILHPYPSERSVPVRSSQSEKTYPSDGLNSESESSDLEGEIPVRIASGRSQSSGAHVRLERSLDTIELMLDTPELDNDPVDDSNIKSKDN